jgi:hypothetical protein
VHPKGCVRIYGKRDGGVSVAEKLTTFTLTPRSRAMEAQVCLKL